MVLSVGTRPKQLSLQYPRAFISWTPSCSCRAKFSTCYQSCLIVKHDLHEFTQKIIFKSLEYIYGICRLGGPLRLNYPTPRAEGSIF